MYRLVLHDNGSDSPIKGVYFRQATATRIMDLLNRSTNVRSGRYFWVQGFLLFPERLRSR